ncbi:AraC-like DNA-binding protein [Kitasatospora viridis]|uniref:AraC-like DNA-binding protein n=1 Tax=Kitasatospora viridis TaxID=281105 RepID=A0A561TTN9_9ACTN|nr:AraC-like DNA-binding protein [Kitasatospora viridis]
MPGAVLWSQQRERAATGPARVLPDGCMDLIWTGRELLVAGPDTTAHLVPGRAGDRYLGLRFAPGTAPLVLGLPASELTDQRVPLEALWPGRAAELTERVWAAPDPAAALERLAVAAGPLRPQAVPEAVLRAVRRGRPVAAIAAELALSERQLRRHCLASFGYGAKTLERVLRLGRALDRARAGRPFAEVAAGTGYADQAHLAREVRALTGVPLTRLLADG